MRLQAKSQFKLLTETILLNNLADLIWYELTMSVKYTLKPRLIKQKKSNVIKSGQCVKVTY